jgi:hypothetical protein
VKQVAERLARSTRYGGARRGHPHHTGME